MSDESRVLILDADGVFLSERPYWNAALGTALAANGLAGVVDGRWEVLADFAFGPVGLQRVTKGVGCNSNWDLAAVLVLALENDYWRGVVEEFLAADGAEMQAMQTLSAAARRLHDPAATAGDPLLGFGIERDSRHFEETVRLFQEVLNGESPIAWSFEPWQLKESYETTAQAFTRVREQGYELRVCTGRHRAEIEAPIRKLDLASFFDPAGITSSDEVDRAEARTGRPSLGKPHWFSPACATVGYEPAVEALASDEKLTGQAVYAGDAWADYRAVAAARERGLDLRYLHVRSGVTTREQEKVIAGDAASLAVVDSLAEIPPPLAGDAR